jgi:hypothetical protein
MTDQFMVLVWNRIKSSIKPGLIGWCIIILGLILRVRHYLANRSLSGDEASLAVNIVSRSFIGLTEPLGYRQAAPVGFLFIQKLIIVVFGNRDYFLRLFPLVSGILAIYLIYRIVLNYFGPAGIFALLMFSLNTWQTMFSSELKQYSSDVMVTLLLVYLSIRCLKAEPQAGDFVWLGIAGIVTIWMSHIAVFILPGIGLALVLEKYAQKKRIPFIWLLSMGATWFLSFSVDYLVALQHTAADRYFQAYWLRAFVPLPPWENIPWLVNVYYKFVLITLNRTDTIMDQLLPLLAGIGGLSLFARQRNAALIIVFPFIMTFIASAWQKYPLSYRFMLFLVPLAVLLMAEGIGKIYSILAKLQRHIALILCGIPVFFMLFFSAQTAIGNYRRPSTVAEIKPVLKYIEENLKQGDVIYIHYRSVPTFTYYAPFYHLDTENIVAGIDRQDPRKALDRFFVDVKDLKGNDRVWFVLSEIPDCGGCKGDFREFFTNYLDENGSMLDSILALNSAAYLYDLNPWHNPR